MGSQDTGNLEPSYRASCCLCRSSAARIWRRGYKQNYKGQHESVDKGNVPTTGRVTQTSTMSLVSHIRNAQCLGAFLQASGNVVPMYYMTTYSTSILSWSSATGSLMLAINNGVNSISRILMGVFADRFGRQNTMISSVRIFFPIWKRS